MDWPKSSAANDMSQTDTWVLHSSAKQTNIKTFGDISEMKKTLLEAGEKGDTFYKVAGT